MIYIVSHKPEKLPELPGYVPIQVGGVSDSFPGYLRDDTGENIARKNPYYCELTAMYWIWKNRDDDFKGLVHYRRYFGKAPFSSRFSDIAGYDELRDMLEDCDIIAAQPARYHVNAREQLLMDCCEPWDLYALEDVVSELQPDYMSAFRDFFAGNRCAQYNMLFCRGERFDAYCAWLFPLLFALEDRVDLSGRSDYQKRLFGFLSERLMNVWIAHNELRVKYLPVVSTAYTLRDHLTYFRRDLTNELRFRLSGNK